MQESTQAVLAELRSLHASEADAHAKDHDVWVRLIVAMQQECAISSDAELGRILDVTRTMVHFVKTKKQAASASMKIKVLEAIGQMQTTEQILQNLKICLPEKISKSLSTLKALQ